MGNITKVLTCYSQPEEDDGLVLYCASCKKDDYSKDCRFCHNCGDPLAVRSNTTTFTQEIPATKLEGFKRDISIGGSIKKFPEVKPGHPRYAPSIARSIQDRSKTQNIPTKDRMSIGYSLHVEGLDEEFISDLQTKAGIVDLGDLLVATREELDQICEKLNLSIGEKLRFRRSVMMHQNMERYSASQSGEWVKSTAISKPDLLTERVIEEDEESAGPLNFDHEELIERLGIPPKHSDFDGDDFISIVSDFADADIHIGDWVKCRKNSMEQWHFGQVIKKGPLLIRPQGWEDAQSFALVRKTKANNGLLENIHENDAPWKNGMAFGIFKGRETIGQQLPSKMLESSTHLNKNRSRRILSPPMPPTRSGILLSKDYSAEDSESELTEDCKSARFSGDQDQFPPPFDQMNLRSSYSPQTDSIGNLTDKVQESGITFIGANTTPVFPKQKFDSRQYATVVAQEG